jgi:hypothetical protein
MSYAVEIAPSQALGWQGLAEALAASGLESSLLETSPGLRVAVGLSRAPEVARALESWGGGRGRPPRPPGVVDAHHLLRPAAA